MSEKQKKDLKDPAFLQNEQLFTKELKSYVLLRHRLSKYNVQVLSYGPFTPRLGGESVASTSQPREDLTSTLECNESRMKNDFPDNPAFIMFLREVRKHFAEMEFRFVMDCKWNRVVS